MNYEVGDRVRVTEKIAGVLGTEVTGHHEKTILDRGKEGTILAFDPTGLPIVQWDSGDYRIFSGYELLPPGMVSYPDAGSVLLEAFVSSVHPDYIKPVDLECVANRPDSAATVKRATQLRIRAENSQRETEALLARYEKEHSETSKRVLQFGEVSKETVGDVPPESYFCLKCNGWVLPRYVQESQAVGAIAVHTGGPFTPVKVLTQSIDAAICSRCGARVGLNAGEYAKELEFEKKHPALARIKKLFR